MAWRSRLYWSPTLLVMVHQWLQMEMGKALSGRGLVWWRRHEVGEQVCNFSAASHVQPDGLHMRIYLYVGMRIFARALARRSLRSCFTSCVYTYTLSRDCPGLTPL